MMKYNLIIEYILSCNTLVLFVAIFQFIDFLVVLIGFFCFGLMYRNYSIVAKFKDRFAKLPIFNRVLAIWFSIFYAIPNKIFVNNTLSKLSVTLSIFLIIVISNFFAPFILLYIIFWMSVLESYFFAIYYEKNVSFRKFVNNKLFKGDDAFAKEYFSFFWGNIDSGGAGKIKSGVAGTLLGTFFHVTMNQEKTHVRVQGQFETQTLIKNSEYKPKTPQEVFALQKEVENHIIDRDTVILKVEKNIHELGKKAWDLYNNS